MKKRKSKKQIIISEKDAYYIRKAESDFELATYVKGRFKGRLIFKPDTTSLCIYRPKIRKDFLGFCNSIAKCLSRYDVKLYLDLSEVTHMSAAASVFLFAEITRWQLALRDDIITYSLPKDKELRAYFRVAGLHEAITQGSFKKLERISANRSPYSSAVDFDHHIHHTLQNISTGELSTSDLEHFQRGLQEAVLNVRHHAYQKAPTFGSRWWQLCYHDVRRKAIHVIVHDRGVGIGHSLRNALASKNSVLFVKPPTQFTDSEVIERAMKLGVSRMTDKPNRGKGSEDLKRPVQETQHGITTLAIWSGRGEWIYANNTVNSDEMDSPLHGTLLEWVYKYDRGASIDGS